MSTELTQCSAPATSNSTCAIHEVVIDSLKQTIENLNEGQVEMKAMMRNNHKETLENVKYVAIEYKRDLERVYERIDTEVTALRNRNNELYRELAKIDKRLSVKVGILVAGATALGPTTMIVLRLMGM